LSKEKPEEEYSCGDGNDDGDESAGYGISHGLDGRLAGLAALD
jgi:hypothetical protein